MILNWLYKKPKLLIIENKKFKTLKILKIVKNFDDLIVNLELLKSYPEIYRSEWNIHNTFEPESLSIEEMIALHNVNPLNIIVDVEIINLKIIEAEFVLPQRQKIFINEYLKDFTNLLTVEEFTEKRNEDHIEEILKSEKSEEELEDEFGKLVNADEYFQRYIDEYQVTGHALFLYDEEKKDVNIYQFHTFKEFYDNLRKILTVYPKEYLRYSVSDELLTLNEYIDFLKLFGPFSNLEKCETIADLNEWIIKGRLLAAVEQVLK